jgi:hypothetical protein
MNNYYITLTYILQNNKVVNIQYVTPADTYEEAVLKVRERGEERQIVMGGHIESIN